jgi:hypothetical protein
MYWIIWRWIKIKCISWRFLFAVFYFKFVTIMKSPKLATHNRIKNILKATFEIEQCWIFAVLWWPFWKWRPVEIFRCRESIQDVEIEQCWICAALWRPFWKWRLVEISRCQESIVRFQRTELIPDIEKFLPVAIFKMATTIPQKFNIVRFQR